MKLRKLIVKLIKIYAKEGNLDVTCWPYDGQGSFYELEQINVIDNPKKLGKRIINLDA